MRTGLQSALRRSSIAALVLIVTGTFSANAEETGLGGFFSHLFAPSQPAPLRPMEGAPPASSATSVTHKPKRKAHDFVPVSTTRASNVSNPSSVQASHFIEVLGDSLAISAAEGLTETLADKADLGVANKAHDASGLVRDDYFDWAKAAADIAASKEKVDYAVILLGINDMQPLRDGADFVEPLTDRWRELYAQRVEAIVAPFHNAHIPVAWVGLPPMRSEHFNTQVAALNQLFKEHAGHAGANYIDIWDAFADQSGQFDAYGPNMEGQNAKLRGSDGIHFTKAGARKLAHFLDAEIRKATDRAPAAASDSVSLPPDVEQATQDINVQIRQEMGLEPSRLGAATPMAPPAKPEAGPIAALNAHPTAPGAALAAFDAGKLREPGEAGYVVKLGEPSPSVSGRADDFRRSGL